MNVLSRRPPPTLKQALRDSAQPTIDRIGKAGKRQASRPFPSAQTLHGSTGGVDSHYRPSAGVAVTETSTHRPLKESGVPPKLPATGIA
jgi:hypothetical protein